MIVNWLKSLKALYPGFIQVAPKVIYVKIEILFTCLGIL